MGYDIIGDVHGYADALKVLLKSMGYEERSGVFQHPERQALFVGDFIDRGPLQVATVNTVRRMVDSGSAQAVMGNHEFNAIAWFMPDPEQPGEYLRSHHSKKYGDKNFQQHKVFLSEVEGTSLHREIIDWFLTLPLWLDLEGVRIVHACWHPSYVAYLEPHLAKGNRLTKDMMVEANREPSDEAEKDTPEPSVFKAVEALLKGIEIPLPAPHSFWDKDGHERSRTRVRWWDRDAVSYRQASLLDDLTRQGLPDEPVPEHVRIGHDGGTPVFVGHYWLSGKPALLSDKVACVDYSVAKNGKLVAYRWDGETVLSDKKFHWISK